MIARFGTVLMLIAYGMFCAGSIAGFIVLYSGVTDWIDLKTRQTVLTLSSDLWIAGGALLVTLPLLWIGSGRRTLRLGFTLLLGLGFLGEQFVLWDRLYLHGIRLSSQGLFSSTFFALNGVADFQIGFGLILLAYLFFRKPDQMGANVETNIRLSWSCAVGGTTLFLLLLYEPLFILK